jgi:hypothetical protein
METTIRICDDCKNKVKEFDCEFCSKDLCKSCSENIQIKVFGEIVGTINICKDCYKQTDIMIKKEKEEGFGKLTNSRIREFVLGELRKLRITENIG